MNKKLIALTLIFVLTGSIFITAAPIADVPSNHWAYQSVKYLVDKGLMELYEDGTFRGNDSVSRYQLAVIVARILEGVDRGTTSISGQDADLLRKLSLELRDELVALAVSGEAFADQIKQIEQKNIIQDEFLAEIKDVDIENLKKEINDLNKRISSTESDVTNIIDTILRIKQLEEKVALIEKDNKEKELIIEENSKKIEELKQLNLDITDETIRNLNDRISINATRINSLQDQLRTLQAELQAKDLQIEELETENKNYKTYVYGLAGVALILLLLSN